MVQVCAIIINYNTSHYTIPAIASIIENTKSVSYQIVVVDNASKIQDAKKVEDYIDKLNNTSVVYTRSKINVGFGGGNMLGVQIALPCKYYAFINNDTLQVSNDCLGRLYQFMEQNPLVGISSPQMLDQNGSFRVTIDHFSSLQREILKRSLLEKLFPKKYLNRKIRYNIPTKVDYVQGSFMFTRADAFNEIGGFDTNLFLYYEESDLSLRLLKNKKLTTFLVPDLEYIHYKNASTTKGIAIKIEQKLSLLYHTRKHYGWGAYKLLIIYFVIRYFFTSLVKPKYWRLWIELFKGASMVKSLKLKQSIYEN